MEHIIEHAARSAAWRKLEVYPIVRTGHRAERALAQYLRDLYFQEAVRRGALKPERERKAPRQTRLERWTEKAHSYATIWEFERACLAELPAMERGAARDKAIAECARAWRMHGKQS